jgi:hypothetical protein
MYVQWYVCTYVHKDTWRRFLNRVQVENFASSKLEVNKFIPIKVCNLQVLNLNSIEEPPS